MEYVYSNGSCEISLKYVLKLSSILIDTAVQSLSLPADCSANDTRVKVVLFLIKQSFFTGRVTVGIAFTQQAFLRVFAPQGRHDSRISVKSGNLARETWHSSAVPGWEFPAKKSEKLPKFPTFSPRRGEPLARCR